MFCSTCGTLNEDNAQFCGGCGTQLICQAPAYPPQMPAHPQPMYQPQPQLTYAPPAQPMQVYQPQPWQPVVKKEEIPGKGMGVAGLVLGIVAIVLSAVWLLSVACALTGAILSFLAMYKARKAGRTNGVALAGLICSSVGFALGITIGLGLTGLISGTFTDVGDVGSDYTTYL